MSATLIEHGQFVDNAGKPLVGGSVYIGVNGADPVANPVAIFSDRALTVAIANPQILGSDGRTANKIWVGGKYSIQVDDSADVQFFQDLDAGSTTSGATSVFVTGIVGGDSITGSTDGVITAYVPNQQYVFETVAGNTGPVTLDIDSVGPLDVVKNAGDPLVSGDFAANQIVVVAYNGTNDNFELVSQTSVAFLPTAGGTMTGQIVLVGDPVVDNDAARKAYVDANYEIGRDQTWQSPARSPGVSYQNTSGRSIFVTLASSTSSSVEVSNNGSSWDVVNSIGASASESGVGFAVPDGGYYRLASGTIRQWRELRS